MATFTKSLEQAISQAIKKGLRYSAKSYFTLVGLMSMGILTVTAICQPISGVYSIQNEVPDLLDLIVNGTTPFLDNAGLNSVYWTNLFREIVYLVVLLFTLVFWFVLLSLSYFSMLEKREAVNLKKEGMHYGERSRLKEYIEIMKIVYFTMNVKVIGIIRKENIRKMIMCTSK